MMMQRTISAFFCTSLAVFCLSNCLACEPQGIRGPAFDKNSSDLANRFLLKQIEDLQQAIDSPQKQLAEMFGGKANLTAVRQPDKVTGFLLPLDSEMDSTEILLDRKRTFTLTEKDQKELSKLLTTHGNYEWGARYLCEIRYGIRIEFQQGKNVVPVYLCMGCGHAGVMLGEKKYEHDIRSENLDKNVVFTALAEILKRALPDEEAIQDIRLHKQEKPYNATPYQTHLKRLHKELREFRK